MAVLNTAESGRGPGVARARCGRRAALGLFLAGMGAWLALGTGPALRAQGVNPKEYQIKAIFLFNFVQFVEWPESAFPNAAAPIRIGVLGDDPFAGALDAAVHAERVRDRPLTIVRSDRLQDLRECHVVFVCRSERAQIAPIVATCSNRPILTVGDLPDFARRGGVAAFYLEGQKVRFEINRAAAQHSGLKLGSQLLNLARIVGPAVETFGGDR